MGDRLRPLWDFDDLDGSERRFDAQLQSETSDAGRAEVLTQLARVQGLRGNFADVELPVDEDMDPVLDHRADTHQEHPLAQNLLADPLLPRPDVRGRQQITAQEVRQDLRVDPIRLDPGFRNRPDLQRVGQVDGAEFLVEVHLLNLLLLHFRQFRG